MIVSTKKLPLRGQRRLAQEIPDFPFNFTKQVNADEHHKLSGADFSACSAFGQFPANHLHVNTGR